MNQTRSMNQRHHPCVEAHPAEPAPSPPAPAPQIQDATGTNVVNLRRTIYLTLMSSMDFEEAGHKLLKMNVPEAHQVELVTMIIECCSQERTYIRYYGLLAQRFAYLNRHYQAMFEDCFQKQYMVIHRCVVVRGCDVCCVSLCSQKAGEGEGGRIAEFQLCGLQSFLGIYALHCLSKCLDHVMRLHCFIGSPEGLAAASYRFLCFLVSQAGDQQTEKRGQAFFAPAVNRCDQLGRDLMHQADGGRDHLVLPYLHQVPVSGAV